MNYLLLTQHRFGRIASAQPLILPDELLDFYGELFLANPALAMIGLTFEEFLSAPFAILGAVTFGTLMPLPDGVNFYALLPKQHAVRERLDATDAGQLEFWFCVTEKQIAAGSPTIRDGALFEKLRHRAWPKHAPKCAVREFSGEVA